MNKKILFRVDGNSQIGAGHIMRCLSIGIAARAIGIECCYIISDDCFFEVLKSNNFRTLILNSDYSKMDAEWSALKEILVKERPDTVIVDSYYVTLNYLQNIRKYTKLIYIDDVMAFAYPVDILVNYNIYGNSLDYLKLYNKKNIPRLLLGSQFVPLREEFQGENYIKIKEKIENVMFSAGGADPERIAIKFAKKIISERRFDKIKFHIVLGSFEPDREELEKISETHNNICTYSNVNRISVLMKKCDIAVSAAGSTLYELCACGVPTITYVLSDNQEKGAKTFADLGIMVNAGDERKNDNLLAKIADEIIFLADNSLKRIELQMNARGYVDGMGARRIAEILGE